MESMEKAVPLIECKCECGEAPLWLPQADSLLWVDTEKPVCFSCKPGAEGFNRHDVIGPFQAIAPRAEGGYIAPLIDKVALVDNELGITEDLGNPVQEKAHLLIGDGTAGPDGCYYFTTYDCKDLYSTEGGIFRVNTDRSIVQVLGKLSLPNGIAFNISGSKLYITEMFRNRIVSYDFNISSGSFSNRSVFKDVPQEAGLPDGLIIDSEGCLWSAHWQGFRVTRYTPEGNIDRVIEVPVPTPTCMAFGGPEMTTLYITTAKKGLSNQQLSDYPDSGNLFVIETGIRGREELPFRG